MLLAGQTRPSASAEASAITPLQTVERIVDRLAPALAIILVLIFAAWAWRASWESRLENDELLEIAAATAPTPAEVVSFLAAGVDYNPPLSHFLVRSSIAAFGGSDWAARLPAFLGVLTLLACLYFFVSQWLSRTYGLLAILTVVSLSARIYARQARPYGLVLGLTALGLVLYQFVVKPGRGRGARALALLGFALVNACLPATHYYAVLIVSAWLLAEAVRIWTSRKVDWPVLASILVPPVVVLGALANVMRAQHAQLSHYFARGNIFSFNHGYESAQIDPLVYAIAAIFLLAATVVYYARQQNVRTLSLPAVSTPELLLALGLLLLPIEGAVCTQLVTHAYLPRYFLAAVIGFTISLCYGVRLLDQVVPGAALGAIAALTLGFGNIVMQEFSRPAERPFPDAAFDTAASPVLFDAPGEYLRVLHYAPALRDRLLVIADPAASFKSRAYDTDDRIMLALASKGIADTTTLSVAAHKWGHFSLVPRPQEWAAALQCLVSAGAQVRLAGPWTGGSFVFDVAVSPESLPHIDDCSAPDTR